MKKIIVVIIMALGLLSLAPVAHADTPNRVSVHEYDLVEKGWTKDRTERLFDIEGTVVYKTKESLEKYYRAVDGHVVVIWYDWRPVAGTWNVESKHWG